MEHIPPEDEVWLAPLECPQHDSIKGFRFRAAIEISVETQSLELVPPEAEALLMPMEFPEHECSKGFRLLGLKFEPRRRVWSSSHRKKLRPC